MLNRGYNKMGKKMPENAMPVYLAASHANSLLAALDMIAAADAGNQLSETAGRLKEKILRHGRTFHAQGEDSVSIYFFPSEVIPLIKILALILSVQMPAEKDYYPMIGRNNRKDGHDAEGN